MHQLLQDATALAAESLAFAKSTAPFKYTQVKTGYQDRWEKNDQTRCIRGRERVPLTFRRTEGGNNHVHEAILLHLRPDQRDERA